MRKRILQTVLIILFLLTLAVSAEAATITVGPGGDYATIQAAVNNAISGDIISIDPSVSYSENVSVVNKSLTFQSAIPGTLVAVNGSGGNCFDLDAGGGDHTVTFFDIEIYGGSNGIYAYTISSGNMAIEVYNCDIHNNSGDGIELNGVNGSIIGDIDNGNTIYENGNGIEVSFSDSNTFEFNTIYGNDSEGIVVGDSSFNTIANNTIYGNGWGIRVLFNSDSSTIANNTIYGNDWEGIYAGWSSDYNTIANNTIYDSGDNGIYVVYSDYDTIAYNTIYGSGDDGIYLHDYSDYITIEGNFIVENAGNGIYLFPTSTNITVNENVICGNIAYGVNNTTGVLLDAEGNWWGDDSGPYHPTTNLGGLGDAVSDNVDYDPWLQMSLTANPPSLGVGDTSTITAKISGGGYNAPDGTSIVFSTTLGTIDPITADTVGGSASSLLSSTIAGTATVSTCVEICGCPMVTPVTIDVVIIVTQIVFITPQRMTYPGIPTEVITIQLQDVSGNPLNAIADITINLSSLSPTGEFSLTQDPFNPITSVVISAGSNSASFYYRDTTVGTTTITAAETPDQGWTDGTQDVVITLVPQPTPPTPTPPPTANISSPPDMQIIKGVVQVIGTAFSEILEEYILEYGEGEDPSHWTLINTSSQPVTDDILGNWDTSSLPDGTYTVRITAKDTEGRNAVDKVTVVVDSTPPQMSGLGVENKFMETYCGRAEWKITAKVTDKTSGIDRKSLKITISSKGMNDIVIDWNRIGYDEITGDIFYTLKANLKRGEYTVEVEVKDKAGNKTEMMTDFTVEAILGMHNVMNTPNPMVNQTTFTFNLCMSADVKIEIYTTAGELVRVLDEIAGEMGYNEVEWDGLDEDGEEVADGVYIYRIEATGEGKTIEEIKTLAVIR